MFRSHQPSLLAVLRLAVVGAAVGWAAVASAEPGQTTWTSYLYQGPSTHYMVIGEVPQATQMDVLGCKDGWCEVSFEGRTGFLMSEIVATGDPSKPAPGLLPQPAAAMVAEPKGPCVIVNEKGGNGGNALTYVCDKNALPAPASEASNGAGTADGQPH